MLSALPLKIDIENAPKNLQTELINLQYDTNFIKKFSETKFQNIYSYIPKDKFPQLRYLGLRIIAVLVICICLSFFTYEE